MSLETLAPPTGVKQAPQSNGTDPMAVMAEKLTQVKAEREKTVDDSVKTEQAQPVVAQSEQPEPAKIPPTNGQSEKPREDAAAPQPEETQKSDEKWTDEMGFNSEAEQATQKPSTKSNDDVVKQYESRIKELEEENSDVFIAAYKEAKKSGKDVFSFIKEVKGVDVEAMTQDQLWEENLKAEGLSVEDISLEMEKFKELSPFERKQKTKTFKQELISAQQENLKKYTSDTQKTSIEREKLARMAEEQGRQFFEKIKDKDWQGMKMTPSEVSKLQNFLEKDFKLQNADGTINFELFAKVGNYALNERTILQNVYKRGETKGYEKALLEISRPSANDKKFNSPPVIKQQNNSDKARQAAKEAWGK